MGNHPFQTFPRTFMAVISLFSFHIATLHVQVLGKLSLVKNLRPALCDNMDSGFFFFNQESPSSSPFRGKPQFIKMPRQDNFCRIFIRNIWRDTIVVNVLPPISETFFCCRYPVTNTTRFAICYTTSFIGTTSANWRERGIALHFSLQTKYTQCSLHFLH